MVHGPTETEVKIRLADRETIRNRLLAAGFNVSKARIFESNTLYDTADQALKKGGTMLRLRQVGSRAVITWKGRNVAGPHKSRPELETSVGSHEILHAILTEIGFQPSFRYEKFRTEFQDAATEGAVTLDETPVGDYLELEGPGSWIDRTAQVLGYSESDYILDSYGKLYLAYCEKHQIEPANMTFASSENSGEQGRER